MTHKMHTCAGAFKLHSLQPASRKRKLQMEILIRMKSKKNNRKLKTHKGIEIKKFKMSAEKLVEHLKKSWNKSRKLLAHENIKFSLYFLLLD